MKICGVFGNASVIQSTRVCDAVLRIRYAYSSLLDTPRKHAVSQTNMEITDQRPATSQADGIYGERKTAFAVAKTGAMSSPARLSIGATPIVIPYRFRHKDITTGVRHGSI
jgi:hypothetical protein